jgi:hypothetical protein
MILFGSVTVVRNFSGKWRAQHHVIRGDVQATILRVAGGDWTELWSGETASSVVTRPQCWGGVTFQPTVATMPMNLVNWSTLSDW